MDLLHSSDSYICGMCNRTFQTLSSFHQHCISHNGAGSFYFDSKTNTGYPKFDPKCCYTQVEQVFFDLNDLDRDSFESIKYGQPRDICDATQHFSDEPEALLGCENTEMIEKVTLINHEHEIENSSTLDTVLAEVDSEHVSANKISDKTVSVEVRNLRIENGCILFDMDNSLSHLYDATVDLILKNIADFGEEWLKKVDRSFTLEVPSSAHPDMTIDVPCYIEDRVTPADHGCIPSKDIVTKPSGKESPKDKVLKNDSETHAALDKNLVKAAAGTAVVKISSGRPVRNRRPTQKFVDNKFLSDLVSITCKNGKHNSESFVKITSSKGGKKCGNYGNVSLTDKCSDNDDIEVNVQADLLCDCQTGTSKNADSNEVVTKINQFKVNVGESELVDTDNVIPDTKKLNTKNEKPVIDMPSKEKCKEIDIRLVKKRLNKSEPDGDEANSLFRKERINKEIRGPKQYKCETCGKYGSLAMLRYHREMHSGKLNYVCDLCGKAYSTKASLRAHKIHHADKQFRCPHCPAAFYRKHYLENHMFKHTGDDPYRHTCEICGERFKESYILRRHVATFHQQMRNYECDICLEKFFRASTLKLHKKRHFEATLPCRFCDKIFKVDLDRRKHELTHSEDKQYSCPRCAQSFRQIWPYYRHMWRIHNIPKDQAKEMKIKNPDIVNMRNIKIEYSRLKEVSTNVNESNNLRVVQQVVKKNVRKGKMPGGYAEISGFNYNNGMMSRSDQWEAMEHEEVAYSETESHMVELSDTNKMQMSVEGRNGRNIVIETGDHVDRHAGVQYVVSDGGPVDEQLGDTIILNMDDGIGQEETIVIKASDLHEHLEYVLLDSGQLVQTGQDAELVIYSDYQTDEVVTSGD
ncbi:zinc finger protein 860-like isoform X3 [Dreissena polymorpha]|uniref:zinc finger protein 860-like isoform X3 n=1 Tax=Dreissena polymorpha TaxID=45954 RepID=UPI002263BE4A|nr:zinc finger protein 860-like isoform X3 [Dreissena polymorpha]